MKRSRFGKYAVFAFVAACTLYAPVLTAQFVSDDWHWLFLASKAESIFPALTLNYEGTGVGGSYNPLVSLWFNVLYRLFGLSPLAFHSASVALHAFTALLVGGLAHRLFDHEDTKTAGIIAGSLFLVWPVSVEAVAWVASVPHLLSAFFYIVTLLFYMKYQDTGRFVHLISTAVSAVLAFGAKESALTLPMALLILEWYRGNGPYLRRFFRTGPFWIVTAGFLYLRYQATGLLFGSYAESEIIFRPVQILNTILAFGIDAVTLGLARAPWMAAYWAEPFPTASLTAFGLFALAIAFIVMQKRSGVFLIVLATIVSSPFWILGFSRISNEGERYSYLFSAFFACAVALILRKVRSQKLVLSVLIILASFVTVSKAFAWRDAGNIAERIIASAAVEAEGVERLVAIGLPDTVGGAHVFRNNLREAVLFRAPENTSAIVQAPAYVFFPRERGETELLRWEKDERGFFGTSVDGSFIVTGFDRREEEYGTFELWNYDYRYFTSDTIRLILNNRQREAYENGSLRFITWNNGRLERL